MTEEYNTNHLVVQLRRLWPFFIKYPHLIALPLPSSASILLLGVVKKGEEAVLSKLLPAEGGEGEGDGVVLRGDDETLLGVEDSEEEGERLREGKEGGDASRLLERTEKERERTGRVWRGEGGMI